MCTDGWVNRRATGGRRPVLNLSPGRDPQGQQISTDHSAKEGASPHTDGHVGCGSLPESGACVTGTPKCQSAAGALGKGGGRGRPQGPGQAPGQESSCAQPPPQHQDGHRAGLPLAGSWMEPQRMIQVTAVILKSPLQGTVHPWTFLNWGGQQGRGAAGHINSFNKRHEALLCPVPHIRQQT